MADEFAKGLGILTVSGLCWMVLSGWYTTASFEEGQLFAAPPENPDFYGQLSLFLRDAFWWFAILGALTFWVIVPAVREVRRTWAERSN